MSLVEQVLAAKTPYDALVLIAAAVDKLQAAASAAPVDPWAGWSDPAPKHASAIVNDPDAGWDSQPTKPIIHDGHEERPTRESAPAPTPPRKISDAEAMEWIAQNYGAELDPDDDPEGKVKIVMAQVKKDLATATDPEVAADLFYNTNGVITSTIDWAPHDEEHRAARYAFAQQILRLDEALGPHPSGGDWAADYASGGPMWFYIPNRDLLIQYPENVKSAMIADVMTYNQKVADEMGGDILKRAMSTDREGGAPQPIGDSLYN